MTATAKRDYSLIGPSAKAAEERGLAAAEWYHTYVPRKRMKELMRRRNGPAIRDTLIWLGLLVGTGFGAAWLWGSWACVPFFICYGVLYGSASDSRWHEAGHGTAFKTAWLNDVLYQIASFMNIKEPTFWRWSHARHHTDTNIVGRDREINAMRPPDMLRLVVNFLGIRDFIDTMLGLGRHGLGHLNAEEKSFIPDSERHKVYREARVWILIYCAVIAAAIVFHTFLPLMLVGLPSLYGRWLDFGFAVTQHAALAEDVLDHRLNTRTIYMNPAFRFVYWNMNYHVEHHMFPMVPYHALAELHREIADDLPAPYPSLVAAYREILPALLRQLRDPSYFIERQLPPNAKSFRPEFHDVVFEKDAEVTHHG